MNLPNYNHAYEVAYYIAYLACCAVLIIWLGQTLHRAGSTFLRDAFGTNPTVARGVAHLLDVGFYLVSLGYVGVSYQMWGMQIGSYGEVARWVSIKLGGFMLMLGSAHVFNLLLLALFRRRGAAATGAAGPASAATAA